MSAALITQYEEHLALVRNLSDNSIKGYVTDLESFLKHMEKLGIVGLQTCKLPVLPELP
jgi:integrase/recombinase XerC